MIEKIDEEANTFQFAVKINELIEASNRQEEAIFDLADSAEDGSWMGSRNRIWQIINGFYINK